MTRQQVLNYLPLVGIALLCLLTGVYLFARKGSSKSGSSGTITKHSVETPADDVLKYWTAEKMSGARPAPLPKGKVVNPKKRQPRRRPQG